MSSVTLALELVSQDARSKEATYAFRLNNYGERPITVQLDELLPRRTTVQQGRSDRQRETEREVGRECRRLELQLMEYHKALRKERKASRAQLSPRDMGFDLRWESLTPFSAAGWVLRAVGLGKLAKPQAGSDEEDERHARDLIPNLSSPKVVLRLAEGLLWVPDDPESRSSVLKHTCEMQVDRVRQLEECSEVDRRSVIVGPGSCLTRTYLVSTRRKHWMRLQRRVVRIEASYQELPATEPRSTIECPLVSGSDPEASESAGNPDELREDASKDASALGGHVTDSVMQTDSVTVVHTVAPFALSVTVFAMLGALAALVMKSQPASLDVKRVIPVLVLAAVFYNVYDLTDVGAKISGSLDWRGALAVGLMCGLLGNPLLGVLESSLAKTVDTGSTSPSSTFPSHSATPTDSVGGVPTPAVAPSAATATATTTMTP